MVFEVLKSLLKLFFPMDEHKGIALFDQLSTNVPRSGPKDSPLLQTVFTQTADEFSDHLYPIIESNFFLQFCGNLLGEEMRLVLLTF